MSSGPEHYAEAEQLLAQADEWLDGEDAPDSFELVHARRAEDLAAAQVHATLALAAATALAEGGMMPGGEFDAWIAVCASQPIPAGAPAQVYWLDDGHENAGKPPLYTTDSAAYGAAVDRYCQDNPLSDPDSDQVDWLAPEDEDDATGDVELAIRGRRTGIFVRPIRPKDVA